MERLALILYLFFIATICTNVAYSRTAVADNSDSEQQTLWIGPRVGRKKRDPYRDIILSLPAYQDESIRMLGLLNPPNGDDLFIEEPNMWEVFSDNPRQTPFSQTETNLIGPLLTEKDGDGVLYNYNKKSFPKNPSGYNSGLSGQQNKLLQTVSNYDWEVFLPDKGDKNPNLSPALTKIGSQSYASRKEAPTGIEDGSPILLRSPPFAPRLGRVVPTALGKV